MIALLAIIAFASCMESPDTSAVYEEDLALRIAGVETGDQTYDLEEEIIIPEYIDRQHIMLNGASWPVWYTDDRLRRSIVHIGDSHLQADMATSVVRDMMQYDYGVAGRGLIEPLRLSGTNEPRDYLFRSSIDWRAERFMNPSGTVSLGFTGCALFAESPLGIVEVGTNDKIDWNPFTSVTLYIDGNVSVTNITDSDGLPMKFEADNDPQGGIIELHLSRPVTLARISIRGSGPVVLRGALLSADRPGLYYHVIGHNGATCSSYTDIDGFAGGVASLDPDLIIISLGTNDSFGHFDSAAFTSRVDALVRELTESAPKAKLLLITPQECDRRVTVRSKSTRKRRSVRQTSFTVNTNVAKARQAIIDYGKRHNIAVYDFYSVAGGAGSAARWAADGLMSKDHVHLTAEGYKVQGRLLYDALSELLNPDFDNGSNN